MFKVVILSTVMCIGLASTAEANCHCQSSGGYDMSTQNGVTVLRGKIKSPLNSKRAVIAARKSAEARAENAERRARRAERDLAQARAAASYNHSHSDYGYSNRAYSPQYNSGRYGYGASISAPRFARGRGFGRRGIRGGGKRFGGQRGRGISRPIFSTRIRG